MCRNALVEVNSGDEFDNALGRALLVAAAGQPPYRERRLGRQTRKQHWRQRKQHNKQRSSHIGKGSLEKICSVLVNERFADFVIAVSL